MAVKANRWGVARFVALGLSVVILTACGDGAQNDAGVVSSAKPAARDYRFPSWAGPATTVWQAAPGVDLLSREGTLVRAHYESTFLAIRWNTAAAFPGFAEYAEQAREPGHFSTGRAGRKGPPVGEEEEGTGRMLLRSVTVSGDTLRGEVCTNSAGNYFQKDLGAGSAAAEARRRKLDGVGPGGRIVMSPSRARYVVMRRVGPEGQWPDPVDRGSSRAPNWNVFAGWGMVEEFSHSGGEALQYCERWAFADYPGVFDPGPPRPRMMYPNGYPDPKFQPTLPQYPGWTRVGHP